MRLSDGLHMILSSGLLRACFFLLCCTEFIADTMLCMFVKEPVEEQRQSVRFERISSLFNVLSFNDILKVSFLKKLF